MRILHFRYLKCLVKHPYPNGFRVGCRAGWWCLYLPNGSKGSIIFLTWESLCFWIYTVNFIFKICRDPWILFCGSIMLGIPRLLTVSMVANRYKYIHWDPYPPSRLTSHSSASTEVNLLPCKQEHGWPVPGWSQLGSGLLPTGRWWSPEIY